MNDNFIKLVFNSISSSTIYSKDQNFINDINQLNNLISTPRLLLDQIQKFNKKYRLFDETAFTKICHDYKSNNDNPEPLEDFSNLTNFNIINNYKPIQVSDNQHAKFSSIIFHGKYDQKTQLLNLKIINDSLETLKKYEIDGIENNFVLRFHYNIEKNGFIFGNANPSGLVLGNYNEENIIKESSVMHEMYHLLDYHIGSIIKIVPYNKMAYSDAFDQLSDMSDGDLKIIFGAMEMPFNDIPEYTKFINEINNIVIPIQEKQQFGIKYLEHYLDLKITETDLKVNLSLKQKISNCLTNFINNEKEKDAIEKLSNKIFEYFNNENSESLYSIVSKIFDKKYGNVYFSKPHEKLARIFQMNVEDTDTELLKIDKNGPRFWSVLPMGIERDYYVTKLNHIVKNELVPFIKNMNNSTELYLKKINFSYTDKIAQSSGNLQNNRLKKKFKF